MFLLRTNHFKSIGSLVRMLDVRIMLGVISSSIELFSSTMPATCAELLPPSKDFRFASHSRIEIAHI